MVVILRGADSFPAVLGTEEFTENTLTEKCYKPVKGKLPRNKPPQRGTIRPAKSQVTENIDVSASR
jgi:hypothetical protein